MNNSGQNKMASGSMTKLIVTMSLPPIVSMFIQAMYNIVDSIFVSKIGMDALTAVSLAFPMQLILVALFVGTGAGVSSLISRRLGEGNRDAASKAASHGFMVSLIYSVLIAIIGIFLTDFFIRLFTDDSLLQGLTAQYLRIILIFSFFNFISNAGISILQSTGNTMMPMVSQLAGALTNIILDPIMIFGYFGMPALGVSGAALATIIGQLVSFILIVIMFKKDKSLEIKLKNFKFEKAILKDMYIVALPAIIMQSLASVMVSGLNLILIAFSDAAVSVLGIYFKLQSFIFMPIFGMMQAFRAILGYNFGAKNKGRVLNALKITLLFSVCIMLAGTFIFQIFTEQLLGMFDSNAEMMSIGTKALRIISLTFPVAAVGIIISTSFQAFGKGMLSLVISFTRQLLILLPAAYVLSKISGLDLFWYSFTLSEILSVLIAVPTMSIYLKKTFSSWK
ncbi:MULTISPECIES: MATE family efflux transporter [unclassified Sedimentibacter]|uniref:MATE family efflux transporter n=1 Tax=unclassified Sedimentibacter TaxID=2649220 RepID=UPI0027E17F6A|nr:MATE family efflux transporter [Sedimentibacter sp. MB35-C1]WMJ77375.1 MATE family efflux transporter [Sedimentibacter sp. MB35-C1]